ncbi:MAG: hypothetical protein AB1505_02275 [Candidatus Latescibacterota bacterium]
MARKEEIAETIRERFETVKERGKILAQALKARADIAATRRRLRNAYADLGEEVYQRMASGQGGTWTSDPDVTDFRRRIDGVRAELRQRERTLEEIMAQRASRGGGDQTGAEEVEDNGARSQRQRRSGVEEAQPDLDQAT